MTSLHPSITHINAKNLSESTIKIINNMVELAINKMESNSTELKTLKQINLESIEGRYLLAAMAKITTESQTDKTPDEVLDQLTELQKHMYKDSPPVINLTTEVTRLREAFTSMQAMILRNISVDPVMTDLLIIIKDSEALTPSK